MVYVCLWYGKLTFISRLWLFMFNIYSRYENQGYDSVYMFVVWQTYIHIKIITLLCARPCTQTYISLSQLMNQTSQTIYNTNPTHLVWKLNFQLKLSSFGFWIKFNKLTIESNFKLYSSWLSSLSSIETTKYLGYIFDFLPPHIDHMLVKNTSFIYASESDLLLLFTNYIYHHSCKLSFFSSSTSFIWMTFFQFIFTHNNHHHGDVGFIVPTPPILLLCYNQHRHWVFSPCFTTSNTFRSLPHIKWQFSIEKLTS